MQGHETIVLTCGVKMLVKQCIPTTGYTKIAYRMNIYTDTHNGRQTVIILSQSEDQSSRCLLCGCFIDV